MIRSGLSRLSGFLNAVVLVLTWLQNNSIKGGLCTFKLIVGMRCVFPGVNAVDFCQFNLTLSFRDAQQWSSNRPWQRWWIMKTIKKIWLVKAALWAAPWALIVWLATACVSKYGREERDAWLWNRGGRYGKYPQSKIIISHTPTLKSRSDVWVSYIHKC